MPQVGYGLESGCNAARDAVAPRESLISRIETIASGSVEIAARAANLAGKLAGYYPPKDSNTDKVQPMPDNVAARIEYANNVIHRSGIDIMRSLDAIEERLS